MTAEIAILNKTAVALATDSAVTISNGTDRRKMFDSGDKLFELCNHNPIGVMINNTMDFVGIPLPSLVRTFRSKCQPFSRVQEAGEAFLHSLNAEGARAPQPIASRYIGATVARITRTLVQRTKVEWQRRVDDLINQQPPPDELAEAFRNVQDDVWRHQIQVLQRAVGTEHASFVGLDTVPNLDPDKRLELEALVVAEEIPEAYVSMVVDDIIYPYLISDTMSANHTGIVIAGFGSDELFPTLVSYRIEGMVFGHLKFVRDQVIDIDRVGRRAAVLPFAQREMVDRFIYGFDDPIQNEIATFCAANLSEFKDSVRQMIEFDEPEEETGFEALWEGLQDDFMHSLRTFAFGAVRQQTQESVEDMVEFMPKPELARMAEALIEVTSLKRRVTQGMETVAGPIDVAVISQSEGFVWVKRKHYFPADLNPRHIARVADQRQPRPNPGEPNA